MNAFSKWRADRSPRRLQIFVHDLGATGVVRNAIALANEASASGYQVRLLTCNADGVLRDQVGPAVAIVKLNGPGDTGVSRRGELKRALIAYRRHSRDWAPDIMVSAGNHGHLLSSLAWLGLPGVKLLRVSNDLAHGSPPLTVRLWRAAKFRAMAWLADQLVYVSRAQAKDPLLAGQLALGRASVIANGVDLDLVRTGAEEECDHPWANDPAVPLILAIGRHVAQKNFPTLLRAFARARAARPMRLLFIGDGKAAEIERLRQLAEELGVGRDVALVAPVGNPFPYMKAARAFALPSLWEGSANVLLEAMACGTPVIASRTAGDADHVLGNGDYGMLVDPRAVDDIAHALLVQTGPDALAPASRAASFSRAQAMRQYIRLFDALLEARRGRAGALSQPSAMSRA